MNVPSFGFIAFISQNRSNSLATLACEQLIALNRMIVFFVTNRTRHTVRPTRSADRLDGRSFFHLVQTLFS